MKTLLATRYVTIPEGVKVDVKSRVVTVTGPRGELTQSFKHLNLDIQKAGANKLRVDLWFGTRKQVRSSAGTSGVGSRGAGCARLPGVVFACVRDCTACIFPRHLGGRSCSLSCAFGER